MTYSMLKLWLYPFTKIMVKNIKGIDNIPKDSNFLVVANHERYVDPLYIGYAMLRYLNEKIHFIASPRYVPYLGRTICEKWMGCILAYPGKTFDRAKEELLAGKVVGIFPEGLLPAKVRIPKFGAIKLAFETGRPILPIAVKSSHMPFKSELIIAKPVYINSKRNMEQQMFDLMERIYKLKGMKKEW